MCFDTKNNYRKVESCISCKHSYSVHYANPNARFGVSGPNENFLTCLKKVVLPGYKNPTRETLKEEARRWSYNRNPYRVGCSGVCDLHNR